MNKKLPIHHSRQFAAGVQRRQFGVAADHFIADEDLRHRQKFGALAQGTQFFVFAVQVDFLEWNASPAQ